MIVLGLEQHPGQLRLELLVLDVPVVVAVGELLPRGTLDEGIELGLLVVLLRFERQLEREPHEARVAPLFPVE